MSTKVNIQDFQALISVYSGFRETWPQNGSRSNQHTLVKLHIRGLHSQPCPAAPPANQHILGRTRPFHIIQRLNRLILMGKQVIKSTSWFMEVGKTLMMICPCVHLPYFSRINNDQSSPLGASVS
jgi:hypothetical protein